MTNAEILAEFRALFLDAGLSLDKSIGVVISRATERAEKRTPRSPYEAIHRGPLASEVQAMWRAVAAETCRVYGVRAEIVIGHRSIPHHCDARHAAWLAMTELGVPQIVLAKVVKRHWNSISKGCAKADGRDEIRVKASAIAENVRQAMRSERYGVEVAA